jgi:HD-GYP domain-containing protein (c-di-GMP phosphodiesterase class II)
MSSSRGHYIDHLTAVNKKNKVVLAEDVLNERGVLVVKKGAEVNKEFALKVAKHKLIKPIEQSVSLSQSIDHEKIKQSCKAHLSKLSISEHAQKNSEFSAVLAFFECLFKYPLVVQKLTVLEERMPRMFGRVLNTSSLVLGMCRELNLSDESIENVFIAHMISDVGLLHIDPNVVNKKGKYTADEWRLMQGHVAIAKHFADQVPSLSPIVSRALLEHHEREDGLGYPFGKKGDKLCIEGQILSIVDSVSGLSTKLVHKQSYSWNAILHIMQMPGTEHKIEVQNAMIRLLRRLQFPHEPAYKHAQYKLLAKQCAAQRKRLRLWFLEFEKIFANHQGILTSNDFDAVALHKTLENTIHETGILNDTQHDWLVDLEQNIQPEDYIELEEYILLLDEVKFRCFFVLRTFIGHEDELAKRVGSRELLISYFMGLNKILPMS